MSSRPVYRGVLRWRHLVSAYEVTAGWRLCDRLAPFVLAAYARAKPSLLLYSACVWLKCNGTQGDAVPPPPIYGLKRSPPQIVTMLEKCTRPLSGAQTLM